MTEIPGEWCKHFSRWEQDKDVTVKLKRGFKQSILPPKLGDSSDFFPGS